MKTEKKSSATKIPSRNFTEEARTLGALLRGPTRFLLDRVYEHLVERGFEGVRPAHSVVFRHLLPNGSRASDLAEAAQMTKQGMAYLLEHLQEGGYIEMVPDLTDRRAKRVLLTEKGRAVQQAALDLSREIEADMGALIGEREMKHLRVLLERLNDRLSEASAG